MLWPVHVQKVSQASEHLCPAKLQTSCDNCCACQSLCPFIPTDSGMSKTVYSKKFLQPKIVHGCVPVRVDSTFCSRFIESARVMACLICASRWEASHCIACVTASASMVRLEVMTLWAPLSSCTVLSPCLAVNPQPDRSLVTGPSVYITMSFGLLLALTSICTSALAFPVGHSRQCVLSSLAAASRSRV